VGEVRPCPHGPPRLTGGMTGELKPSRDIAVLLEVMKRLRDRLPLGQGPDLRHHRALHHRGSL